MSNFYRQSRGFTLVELMMYVSIVSLLAVIALPSFSKARNKSLNTKCIGNQRKIWEAVQRYEIENNTTLFALRSSGVDILNILVNADLIRRAEVFECPLSQVADNDDILLTYSGVDFVNTYCSIAGNRHLLQ